MENSSTQRDREKKQNYLREKIIDSGYDPNTFQDYLDGLKNEGGANIDIWSFDELIKVVDDFKKEMESANIKPELEEHLEEAKTDKVPEETNKNSTKEEEVSKKDGGAANPEEKKAEPQVNRKPTVFDDFITSTKQEMAEVERASLRGKWPTTISQKSNQNVQSDEDTFYRVVNCRDIKSKGLGSSQELHIRVQK